MADTTETELVAARYCRTMLLMPGPRLAPSLPDNCTAAVAGMQSVVMSGTALQVTAHIGSVAAFPCEVVMVVKLGGPRPATD